MKTKFTPIVFLAALLLLSACAAGKPAPRNPAPVKAEPSGIYTARTVAAELHIVSPGGRIRIGNLEIDDGKPPLVAQIDSPAPAQCPFPAPPAAPSTATNREAQPAPAADSVGDVGDKPVEQVERTDAAPAGEYREPEARKGRLPGKLPE